MIKSSNIESDDIRRSQCDLYEYQPKMYPN